MKGKQQESDNEPNINIPCAPELEKSVLGTLMIEKDAYFEVSNILTPCSFYEYRHQLIYRAITDLAISHRPIDILTVKERLDQLKKLEEVGGSYYITQLSGNISSTKHIKYHARIIAQKYMSRQLLTLATEIRLKASDDTQNTEDLISEIRGKLNDISLLNTERDCTPITPVIFEVYKSIQEAASHTNGISGIETGFTELDKLTSGWQNSDLIVIGARPSMGKTAFITSMLKNMAVNSQIPVALFSLEMSKAQVVNRLLSNVCEIPVENIKSGQLAPYESQQLDYKLKDLLDAPIYIDDSPTMTIEYLYNKAHYLVREENVKLIVIDYMQLLYTEVKYTDAYYSETRYFTKRLKSLAKELNIPIIVTSQLNRSPEYRDGIDGKRPQLADLRDSGTLCEGPDIVIFLHRPEYYRIYQDDRGNDLRRMAEVIIAKQRNGATGKVLLRFNGKFTRFSNPEDDMVIPMPGENILKPSKNKNTLPPSFNDKDPMPF